MNLPLRIIATLAVFLITFFAFAETPNQQTDYLNMNLAPSELEALMQEVSQRPPATELTPDLDIHFNPDDMKNPNDWKRKYFDVVVVVDKSEKVQLAWIYRSGKLDRTVKVSTGREKVEKAGSIGPNKPIRDTVSQTHTGYFTPTLLDIDYVSTLYEDSEMPWSVFYNLDQGEATHRAPAGTETQLGTRASGGCVRLSEKWARHLFWLVRLSGGPYTQAELESEKFTAESELLSQQPYDDMPEIPKFDITGELEKDSSGAPVLHKGYKALFIVLNSSL